MATGATSPDGIAFLQSGSTIDPVVESSVQASTIQAALANRPFYQYVWPTAANRQAQTGMRVGDQGFQVDTSTPFQYINSSAGWQPTPFGFGRAIAGGVTVTPSGSASPWRGNTTVNFPTNFFSGVPYVLTNPVTTVPDRAGSGASNITSTGFTVYLGRTDGAIATTVYWMAMQ